MRIFLHEYTCASGTAGSLRVEGWAMLTALVADLRCKGARVLVAEPGSPQSDRLPALPPDHPDADAICMIQSFYALLVKLAAERGTDADRPRHLQKITRTR